MLYTNGNDGESCNSYNSGTSSDISTLSDESSDQIFSGTRQKKITKNFNEKEGNGREGPTYCH